MERASKTNFIIIYFILVIIIIVMIALNSYNENPFVNTSASKTMVKSYMKTVFSNTVPIFIGPPSIEGEIYDIAFELNIPNYILVTVSTKNTQNPKCHIANGDSSGAYVFLNATPTIITENSFTDNFVFNNTDTAKKNNMFFIPHCVYGFQSFPKTAKAYKVSNKITMLAR